MFERNPKLPIKGVVLTERTILNRVIELIHKVLIFRESVKVAIKRVQQRMMINYPV